MTVITLPPDDAIRVETLTDLPATEIDGLIGVVKDTDQLYVYDRPSGTWKLASGGGFITSVTDTNSVDLTVAANSLSADVKLSAAAASAGNTKVNLDIQSDGLRAQVANSAIQGLITVTDTNSVDLTYTAGNLSADARISSNAAAANNTIVALNVESTGVVGLRAQIANSGVRALLSATAPVAYDNTTGIISMPAAATAQNGYLTSTDWNTFNGKVSTTRAINTTAPLTGGGNLSADRTLSIPAATAAVDGYLAAADFTTFNSKVGTTRAINTTAPLNGGGNLSADRTLTITQSATGADGYLSSVDWNTFNNKVGTARSISTTAPLAGGGNLSADRTLSITQSATAADGYLSSVDWNTFNNKVATTRSISTTAPLAGGGNLSADRTLSIPAAATAQDGYLTSTNWNTFNGKQDAITIGALGTGATNGLVLTTGTLVLHAATATQPGAITAVDQTFAGSKTFGGAGKFLYRDAVSANTSFRSLVAPTSGAFSPTSLQSCSATFGGFYALFYIVDNATGKAALLSANFSVGGISVVSDSGSLFLGTDAGTGIYVSKPSSSMVISFKNRLGGTNSINIVGLNSEINSISAWA